MSGTFLSPDPARLHGWEGFPAAPKADKPGLLVEGERVRESLKPTLSRLADLPPRGRAGGFRREREMIIRVSCVVA
jgi:hypothetical protein